MSRFGPTRCYECGEPLGDMYELFNYLRSVINNNTDYRSHIDKRMLDAQDKTSIIPVWQAMDISHHKICCRKILDCTVTPQYLESRGTREPQ